MRTIEISEEVWAEIAKRGKFGESEDDVLRREFDLPASPPAMGKSAGREQPVGPPQTARVANARPRPSVATKRMSSFVRDRSLVVEFQGGPRKTFGLSDPKDKAALRRVRDQAVAFAAQNGASYGQEMAVKKALTEAGFHLMR